MAKRHKIRQGECLSSVAFTQGFLPDTLWSDSENTPLQERRKDPNVLFPGDIIVIRDKQSKEESCVTEQRHRFRRKGTQAMLRLRLLEEEAEKEEEEDSAEQVETGEEIPKEKPRAYVSYTLNIDGQVFSGKTDGEGMLEHPIPPNAKKGELIIEDEAPIVLLLGYLDPVEYLTGVQARLNNVGFSCGKVDGIYGPKTKAAVRAFQTRYTLTVDGIPGPQTQAKLKEIHGC